MTKVKQPQLDAWKGLLRAHATAITQIEARLAEAGSVPLTSYDVLLELSNAPRQRLRMAELAERVVLSRSGLTRLVDRLEREGYLTRESTKEDRRGTEAVLTDEGLQALRKAWPVYAEGIKESFATYLSDEEAATLAAVLGRVASAAPLTPTLRELERSAGAEASGSGIKGSDSRAGLKPSST